MYVVICVFFFAVDAYNKKIVQSCNFFCGKSCKPVTRISAKNFSRLDDFFVHAFTAEKKITRSDGFFVSRIYRKKKNYTTYRKKKLHDLPQKNNYTM